jgi:hypothetical protein
MQGHGRVASNPWFQRVDVTIRTTRRPTESKQQASRLETRRHFFSNRVVEAWNLVPSEIKSARTVISFKNACTGNTERPRGATRLNKMEMEY